MRARNVSKIIDICKKKSYKIILNLLAYVKKNTYLCSMKNLILLLSMISSVTGLGLIVGVLFLILESVVGSGVNKTVLGFMFWIFAFSFTLKVYLENTIEAKERNEKNNN